MNSNFSRIEIVLNNDTGTYEEKVFDHQNNVIGTDSGYWTKKSAISVEIDTLKTTGVCVGREGKRILTGVKI